MAGKKKVFEGYTTKEWGTCWTFFNTLNIAFVVQKTRNEAIARYDNGNLGKDIKKVRITIEEIK